MPETGNLPWWSASRPWGFRLSRRDLLVILVGALLSWHATAWSRDAAILIPFVLGHFFLFCNVFRAGQPAELVWGGLLLANIGIAITIGSISWWIVLPLQCVVTVAIIGWALSRPDYHGIGCQRLNPLGYRPESRRPRTSLLRSLQNGLRLQARRIDLLQRRSGLEGD